LQTDSVEAEEIILLGIFHSDIMLILEIILQNWLVKRQKSLQLIRLETAIPVQSTSSQFAFTSHIFITW